MGKFEENYYDLNMIDNFHLQAVLWALFNPSPACAHCSGHLY